MSIQPPEWYPPVTSNLDLSGDMSPWGPANQQILQAIDRRLNGKLTNFVDIAGGDGRYATELASRGHNVTVVDIHQPSLAKAALRGTQLPKGSGTISTVLADVRNKESMSQLLHIQRFGAMAILGFLYLAPPETAKTIFRYCTTLL
jgi:SAM-dependent methyltransferase